MAMTDVKIGRKLKILLGRVHTRQSNTNTSEIDTSGKDTGKFVEPVNYFV
jgi:hypothetical protein